MAGFESDSVFDFDPVSELSCKDHQSDFIDFDEEIDMLYQKSMRSENSCEQNMLNLNLTGAVHKDMKFCLTNGSNQGDVSTDLIESCLSGISKFINYERKESNIIPGSSDNSDLTEENADLGMLSEIGHTELEEAIRIAEEPIPTIREWNEKRKRWLEEKDVQEKKDREKEREMAIKELDDWYNKYRESQFIRLSGKTSDASECEHTPGENSDTNTAGNEPAADQIGSAGDAKKEDAKMEKSFIPCWDYIAQLCGFDRNYSHNVKDTARMKSVILQMKYSSTDNKSEA